MDERRDGELVEGSVEGRAAVAVSGITYGYARVSSSDQNLARQYQALTSFGIEEEFIFADRASGKDFDRPAWQRLVETLREGDALVVLSIDRLGRSYDEIIEWWHHITKRLGVGIVVLDMPLLDSRGKVDGVTGALVADIVLQLLSYVAQVERESILARQAEGIAAARERGVHLGREAKKRPKPYGNVCCRISQGDLCVRDAARLLGVSVRTLYNWRREDGLL